MWSPDGQDIAFARQHIYVSIAKQTLGLTSTMWIIHPDGTGARQLTSAVTGQADVPGAFSPDGHTLAFTLLLPSSPVAGPGPDPDKVELLSLTDGTITTLATAAGAPAYSPDGKWIALVSPRDHNGTHPTGEDSSAYANELYLINLATHRWQRLTHTNGIDEEDPSFSPDGQRIAYLRVDAISTRNVSDNYHYTIYEININGSCPTRIRDDLADRFE